MTEVKEEKPLDKILKVCSWPALYYGIISGLINKYRYRKCVEVGVAYGFHAMEILSNTSVEYTGVDPYVPSYDPSDQFAADVAKFFGGTPKEAMDSLYNAVVGNLKTFGNRGKLLRMKSADAVGTFENESIDLVFIDGDHRYETVLADLKAWWPKIKKDGMLCGDDYMWPDVKKAVTEFAKENGDLKVKLLYKPGQTHPIYSMEKE